MFATEMYRLAGVAPVIAPDNITAASVSSLRSAAIAAGTWHTSGRVPPGAMVVHNGFHVEIAINHRADGLVDCVGGNWGQAVRLTVRQIAGLWGFISQPSILQGNWEPITVYGYDDPQMGPTRVGAWAASSDRDKAIGDFTLGPGQQFRKARLKDGRYALYIVNLNNRFGPWRAVRARDQAMIAQTLSSGHPMSPWSMGVGTGGVSTRGYGLTGGSIDSGN